MRLGLVTSTPAPDSDAEEEEEEWDDLDEESEEEKVPEYRLSTHRRSSIDLMSTVANECEFGGSNSSNMDITESQGLIVDFDNSLRTRSRKPGVSSIYEEAEGFNSSDDMCTLEGDDVDED